MLAEAVALQDAGRLAEAATALRRALALEPAHAEALTRLGWVLNRLGRHDEAIAAHRDATQAAPAFAAAWSNLGVALQARGDHDEALAVLRHAVSLDANLAESRVNLGLEWQARGLMSEAAACYREAIARNPRLAETWTNLGIALQEAGDVSLAIAASRRALRSQPDHPAALSNAQMTRQYAADLTLAGLRRAAEATGARYGPELPLPPRDPWTDGARRLRVGYVSGDLYAHPVGWMACSALVAHDRERFEVHCYADRIAADFMTEEIRAGVEHWHPVRELDDAALRELVFAHGIDVLVDLAGHTASNRLAVFAKRAAPVQLSWLGFAASTGVAAMDGAILGEAMAPPGAQEAFTEPLLRLPRCHFTYRAPGYAPPVAPPPEERAGRITLGSFNNPAKMGPDVLRVWAQVLAGVPGSRLVLKWRMLGDANAAERVRRRFALLGIEASRIELRGASPHEAMLAEYGDIDIALDPFPFCGGLTTCEALWMGVPVVTLPWLRPMSRQGLAIHRELGLEDLVARTPREYVATVVALAGDRARRAELRRTLRARMAACALGDGRGLARALESQYARAMAAKAGT